MGLFGLGKKAPKNQMKTPWGYAPYFTSEDALPNDINQLRGMSYYYRNREPDERIAHIIHRKIVGMGTGFPYVEYNRYLGIDYFNGRVVPKDVSRGSELFLKWVDWAIEESSGGVNLQAAIVQYFNWGFTDCLHLLESLNKRIAKEHRENADLLGLWVYRLIFSVWQYSEVKKHIRLGGTHMPYFMQWLQDNMGIDYSYWITKILAKEEGTHFTEDAAEAGNIFAIEQRIEYYSHRKGDNAAQRRSIENNLRALQDRQKAIYDSLRKAAATHDHSRYVEQKERMDRQINKYADFFRGTRLWIPEDYPFFKGKGSVYHSISEAVKIYELMAKEAGYELRTKRCQEFSGYIKDLEGKGYLPAAFLKLQAAGESLLVGTDHLSNAEMRVLYNDLVEKGYADAIRLKTECRPEEIPLVRILRCNPEVTAAYRKELQDKCMEACDNKNWADAIVHLYFANEEGGMEPLMPWRDRIVGRAVSLAYDLMQEGKYQESERIAYFGAELGEAYACHIMAILYYNHKGGDYYVKEAKRYLNRCIALRGSTIFDLDDGFYASVKANLALADQALDKIDEGYTLASRNHY